MLHAACPLQPSSRQGDARKLASSSSTKFCTGSLPLTLHQEETVIFFSNENSYSLNSILTRHFTIRCEWSTICVPFLGSLRENERNRDLKKLFRFVTLSLSLTIIFIHIPRIPRIFSFREERERVKNNWRNNKIISIRAHTRFVKVQRL